MVLPVLWIRVLFLPDPDLDPDPTFSEIPDPDPRIRISSRKKGGNSNFFLFSCFQKNHDVDSRYWVKKNKKLGLKVSNKSYFTFIHAKKKLLKNFVGKSYFLVKDPGSGIFPGSGSAVLKIPGSFRIRIRIPDPDPQHWREVYQFTT